MSRHDKGNIFHGMGIGIHSYIVKRCYTISTANLGNAVIDLVIDAWDGGGGGGRGVPLFGQMGPPFSLKIPNLGTKPSYFSGLQPKPTF